MLFKDVMIHGTSGQIFSRIWSPSDNTLLPPIILLHDSLGSVELWRDFPERLCEATQRTVIAYDRPGFGKSHSLDSPISTQFIPNEALETFADIRKQLKIQKFVVLGHSVGGGMALHCAAQYPEDCDEVITLAAQSFVEDKTLNGIRAAQKLFSDPTQIERLKKYHGDKTQWVLDSWMQTWLSDDFASWSLTNILPNVKARSLVIHGINDEYGSAEHPQRIADLSGNHSTLMLMENTTHFPHREQSTAVLIAIEQFLDTP